MMYMIQIDQSTFQGSLVVYYIGFTNLAAIAGFHSGK